jgi:hypothetical protein
MQRLSKTWMIPFGSQAALKIHSATMGRVVALNCKSIACPGQKTP